MSADRSERLSLTLRLSECCLYGSLLDQDCSGLLAPETDVFTRYQPGSRIVQRYVSGRWSHGTRQTADRSHLAAAAASHARFIIAAAVCFMPPLPHVFITSAFLRSASLRFSSSPMRRFAW